MASQADKGKGASFSGWGFTISLGDPIAQRIVAGGIALVFTAVAVVVFKQNGLKLIVEHKEEATKIVNQAAQAILDNAPKPV